jgi:hypothetical protein
MPNNLHAAAVEAAKRIHGSCYESVAACEITAAYAPLVQALQRVLCGCGTLHPVNACPCCMRLQDELRRVVGDN